MASEMSTAPVDPPGRGNWLSRAATDSDLLPMLYPYHATATPTRIDDVRLKHARVCEFLEDARLDALLLESRENFAWYTSGGDNTLGTVGATCAALFVTRDSVIAVVPDPHVQRIQIEQLAGLDIEVRPVPWQEPPSAVLEDLRRGLRTGSDRGSLGTSNESLALARLRIDLTPLERERYREVGRAVAHAVEATARHLEQGQSEAEVAGQLSHRLIKHDLMPIELYVAADDRLARYGRPVYGTANVDQRCWIAATAMRYGMCVTCSRTVCFGTPEADFIRDFEQASMAAAAAIYYSRPGSTVPQVLERVERTFRKRGRPEEYSRADPGSVTGYTPCEMPLHATSQYRLGDPIALVWRPVMGSAASCDTIVVDHLGYDIVSGPRRWPQIQIEVSGHRVERPDMLLR